MVYFIKKYKLSRKEAFHEINLFREAQEVESKEELISFLEKMAHDFNKDEENWENQQVDDFLQSMSNWLEDVQEESYFEQMNWNFIAKLLYMGKIHE